MTKWPLPNIPIYPPYPLTPPISSQNMRFEAKLIFGAGSLYGWGSIEQLCCLQPEMVVGQGFIICPEGGRRVNQLKAKHFLWSQKRRYKAKTSNLGTTHTERPTDLTNSKYQQQQHKYTTQVWGLPELKLVFHFSSFEDCPSRYYSNINIRIIRICPNLFSNYSVLKWNDLSQQEIQVSSSRWSFVTSCTPFLPSSCISSGFHPKFKGFQPKFTNTLNKFYTNSEPSFKFNSISIIRIKSKFCPRSLTKDPSARKCKILICSGLFSRPLSGILKSICSFVTVWQWSCDCSSSTSSKPPSWTWLPPSSSPDRSGIGFVEKGGRFWTLWIGPEIQVFFFFENNSRTTQFETFYQSDEETWHDQYFVYNFCNFDDFSHFWQFSLTICDN